MRMENTHHMSPSTTGPQHRASSDPTETDELAREGLGLSESSPQSRASKCTRFCMVEAPTDEIPHTGQSAATWRSFTVPCDDAKQAIDRSIIHGASQSRNVYWV